MKYLKWMLLFTMLAWSEEVTVRLAPVSVTVNASLVKNYEVNETFDLAYGEDVCLVGGDGLLSIEKASGDTETLSLLGKKKVCLTLEEPIVPPLEPGWLEIGMDAICKESSDVKVNGVSRKEYEETWTDGVRTFVCD